MKKDKGFRQAIRNQEELANRNKEVLKCKGICLNVDPPSPTAHCEFMESLVRDAVAGRDTNEIGKSIIDKAHSLAGQ